MSFRVVLCPLMDIHGIRAYINAPAAIEPATANYKMRSLARLQVRFATSRESFFLSCPSLLYFLDFEPRFSRQLKISGGPYCPKFCNKVCQHLCLFCSIKFILAPDFWVPRPFFSYIRSWLTSPLYYDFNNFSYLISLEQDLAITSLKC